MRKRVPAYGIPDKKNIKFKKDLPYLIASTTSASGSWNTILSGCAQVFNDSSINSFLGNSVSPLDSQVDPTNATGLLQWFGFYRRCIVHGIKVRVQIHNNTIDTSGIPYTLLATLVPTVGTTLASQGAAGTTTFDASGVIPGELPYAKKAFIASYGSSAFPGNAGSAGQATLSAYYSIKKLLNVKDLQDVASGVAGSNDLPFVPTITDPTTASTSIQPLTGSGQDGVYWNLILQNVAQNQLAVPTDEVSPGAVFRITCTYYAQFSDRFVLPASS